MFKEKIEVLVKRPDHRWQVKTVDNTLEAFQQLVGGFIEPVGIGGGNLIICNEEGRINGLPYNMTWYGNDWYGNIVVCSADDDGNFCDVSYYFKAALVLARGEANDEDA